MSRDTITTAAVVAPEEIPPSSSTHFVYALHSSRPLPVLDGTKSIKHVVLHPAALRSFNRFLHKARGWITLCYSIGFAFSITVFFVDAHTGSWFAVPILFLQLPSYAAAYLVLRYDFVWLITKTFEFWYAIAVIGVCFVVICLSYSDWRIMMVISSTIAYEIPFLMDAVHRATAITVVASVTGAVLDLAYIALISFSLIRDVRPVSIYTSHNFRLAGDDVVMNGLGTIAVLLLRNAYRKYHAPVHRRETSSTRGAFIMYRCCLELRLIDAMRRVGSRRNASMSSARIQLFHDHAKTTFDATKVVWPRRFCGVVGTEPWSHHTQRALWAIGVLGIVSLVIARRSAAMTHDLKHQLIHWIALGCSLVFCSTYFAHTQRDLLFRELCKSFDFVFMASQFTVANICGCIMFDWDKQCVLLLTSTIWSFWIITLDAVTPVMKRKLGYDWRGAVLVVVMQLLEQILAVVSILFFDPFQGRDYSIAVLVIGGHTENVRVVQFLMWRLVTCFLWSARLLWRLLDRKGDELLVLQGLVEYMEPEHRRDKLNTINPTTKIRSTDLIPAESSHNGGY